MTTRQPPSFREGRVTARDEFPNLPADPVYGVKPDPDASDYWEQLPDALQQGDKVYDTITTISRFFRGRQGILVHGNSPVYYLDGEGRRRLVSPDCYIALGVDPIAVRRRNAYYIDHVGFPPAVVIEIASVSTAQNDLGPKRDLYARLGVPEYWRFDGTGGEFYGEPLVGEELVNGEYVRLPVTPTVEGFYRGYSPALGLDFQAEPDRLRLINAATGESLNNLNEAEDAREAAQAAREAERAARLAAEAEVRRLSEELRRRG